MVIANFLRENPFFLMQMQVDWGVIGIWGIYV